MIRIYGDNGVYLGYRSSATNNYVICIRENGNNTYPKSLSVFSNEEDIKAEEGYSVEINAPIKMRGQSIDECSNVKTLGIEIVDPVAFYSDSEEETRTFTVTKNSQDIIEYIGTTEILNGEAIVSLPENIIFKNYVLSPIGLDRKVSLIEKNTDNFKIVGDDGIVDYVIKFESVSYTKYMSSLVSEMNYNIDYSETIEPEPLYVTG